MPGASIYPNPAPRPNPLPNAAHSMVASNALLVSPASFSRRLTARA